MNLTEQARLLFQGDRYSALTGIEIDSVEHHCCRCHLDVRPAHRNALGVAMGGCQYTMADFAAAVAANSEYIESGSLHYVTLQSTIHYLAPATADRLDALCIAIKHGRTTALYRTTLTAPGDDRPLAVADTTMVRAL